MLVNIFFCGASYFYKRLGFISSCLIVFANDQGSHTMVFGRTRILVFRKIGILLYGLRYE